VRLTLGAGLLKRPSPIMCQPEGFKTSGARPQCYRFLRCVIQNHGRHSSQGLEWSREARFTTARAFRCKRVGHKRHHWRGDHCWGDHCWTVRSHFLSNPHSDFSTIRKQFLNKFQLRNALDVSEAGHHVPNIADKTCQTRIITALPWMA
jgi:hypothetical protein